MIPITKPFLEKDEADAARETILSGWVTQGPRVKEFEAAFARAVGARYACAVSSCTTALHLALLAIGIKPGDVVFTVSHSFIATANAIRYCGAEPVFVDIDPDTYNMDPDELERTLEEDCIFRGKRLYYKHVDRLAVGESPLGYLVIDGGSNLKRMGRVAAILPVHQMGIPCDVSGILNISKKFEIPVVEDAACAVGSEILLEEGGSRQRIGRPHGKAACFSFHPRKILTTGDGGMITTDKGQMDASFRLMRHHGMSVSDIERHGSKEIIFEKYLRTGFNYRMTDIQAAVGIEQLKKLDHILNARRALASAYGEMMKDMDFLKLLTPDETMLPNWQSYPVRLLDGRFSQMDIMQKLMDRGIATRRGIMNIHQEPAYSGCAWNLPKSEQCRDSTFLLPLFPGMTMDEAEYVSKNIHEIFSC